MNNLAFPYHIRMAHAVLCASMVALSILGYSQEDKRFEFSRPKMGTEVRIVLYAPDSAAAHLAAGAAYGRIDELNRILSDYIEDSELSQLNETAGTGRAVRVSSPLFEVIERGLAVSRETGGSFDMTVGPYVRLWRKSRRTGRLPSKEELRRARKSVGFQYVKLDSSTQSVKLLKDGMRLDPGGIGKGYAADEALQVLTEHGITSALVDAGGDIRAGEAPPGEKGWRIRVRMINKERQPVDRVVTLRNRAVASSGDLYQYVEIGGKRYSHIVDPRTGLGLTDRSRVTVIAPDGITADSYASAISVLGPLRSRELVRNRENLDFYFIRNNNGALKSWHSTGFSEMVKWSNALGLENYHPGAYLYSASPFPNPSGD